MFVGAAVGLVTAFLLPIGQSSWSHRREAAQSVQYFKYDAALDAQRHKEKLLLMSEQYKVAHSTTLEQHAEGMSVALDLSRRETVRDVWVQRSLLNQTIMLNGALMLACCFENFSQSSLPRTDTPIPLWLLYALNGTLGVAIFLCTLCIVLCLKIQERLGWYALGDPKMVYHCGKTHATFNAYFDCHCEGVRSAADLAFYCAGAATIMASILLQIIKYNSNFHDDSAVLIVIHTLSAAAGVVALPFLVRHFSFGQSATSSSGEVDYGGLGGATEEEREQAQHLQARREAAAATAASTLATRETTAETRRVVKKKKKNATTPPSTVTRLAKGEEGAADARGASEGPLVQQEEEEGLTRRPRRAHTASASSDPTRGHNN